MIQKRGQAWGLDVTIAAMIFIAGVVFFYLYIINFKTSEGAELEEARFQARLVAESFLSEGTPLNWNTTTVTKIGVLSDSKVNDTKLASFYTLSMNDYERTKQLFGTQYDYFINFSDLIIINSVPIQGFGRPLPAQTEITLKVTRFTSYKNKPVAVNIRVWKT